MPNGEGDGGQRTAQRLSTPGRSSTAVPPLDHLAGTRAASAEAFNAALLTTPGYRLFRAERRDEAIAIFTLSVE